MINDKINPSTKLTVACLDKLLSDDRAQYTKAHNRAKRIDALDRNKLWEALSAKFPSYQLLPQTNHVSYIKNNIVANVYAVGKSATLECTSEADRDVVTNLNIALEHIWDTRDVAQYELEAGERAALLNLGITQVGWDNTIVQGKAKGDNFEKGQVVLKNIDPLKYYRDPYAKDLDSASHIVTWEDYHISYLETVPAYEKALKQYIHEKNNMCGCWSEGEAKYLTDKVSFTGCGKPGYHRIYTWYVREDKKIHEIHVIDGRFVLLYIDDVQPSMFPFAELYCNLPSGDLLGTSECAKIADNSIVYNLMNSILATSEYKNQRPPRFISATSGINVNAFVKHGNDADKTFVVQGDASKAVHYHQYPQPSAIATATMATLQNDIQMVTGIDGRYTGRDTGSVITTGGVDSMLNQVSLIDTAKIVLYEKYAKRLSELIIRNYIKHSALGRKYLVKDPGKIEKYNTVYVDFPKIPDDILMSYSIDISSDMPKNKARLAATADAMMEKQMQYQGAGIDVDLITPQEWLMMQDLPHKEYFLERMGIQRSRNWSELVSQAVTTYAGLVDNGMPSADALAATADILQQQSQPGQSVNMDNVAASAQLF